MDLTYDAVSNAGERVLVGDNDRLMQSHRERYQFAARWVSEADRVLDCACGSGYGSDILARRASQVIGVDLSETAIGYAKNHYLDSNLNFRVGSVYELPVPDGIVDLYVNFETIEHVEHPLLLVEEAWRVVTPGGRFLVSTPNRVNSGLASGERPKNPFHLFEWSLSEFDEALRNRFQNIRYYGQRVRSQNKLHPKYVSSKLKRALGWGDFVPVWTQDLARFEDPAHWQPENFIAVCTR